MTWLTSGINNATAANFNGAGTNYLVETPSGVLYYFYIDNLSDIVYQKSTDRGFNWSARVVVFAGTATNFALWYDRWSDIAAGLIHCAYSESATDDTLYRSVDTENSDTLGTQTVIFAGASTASGGMLSITRARGGNLYCRTVIDAGAEGGFFRSTDVGGTWASRTVNEALATTDQMILLPGFAADNQDIMGFFWDASANEISRQLYDDSANTWAETSIAASMTDTVATASFPHFAAAVDLTNSRNLLAAWSAVDLVNSDLRVWHVTESAITEVTNVVTDSTDDQGLCAIGIDVNDANTWYVFYAGASDGSETWNTAVALYYKMTKDAGTTWSSEQAVGTPATTKNWMAACPRFIGLPKIAHSHEILSAGVAFSMPVKFPRATFQLGL